MAIVFDSANIKGMRVTHFQQLMAYLENREQKGWYYGDKKHFEKRHNELKQWLGGIINYASTEGIIIPKE